MNLYLFISVLFLLSTCANASDAEEDTPFKARLKELQKILESDKSTQEPLKFEQYQEHRSTEIPVDFMADHYHLKSPNINRYKERVISHSRNNAKHFRNKGRKSLHGKLKGYRRHKHHDRMRDYTSDEVSSESGENYFDTEGDYSYEQWNTPPEEHGVQQDIDEPINEISYNLIIDSKHEEVKLDKNGVISFSQWRKEQPVKIAIHGFFPHTFQTTQRILEGPLKILSAYLSSATKFNLILCNWTAAARVMPLEYSNGQLSIKQVGEDVAKFLMNLQGTGRIKQLSDVHLIGFSLGAHIAGVAGWHIQKYNGGLKLGRITGLDPANTGFDTLDGDIPQDASGILDRSDADFVDIIHCNQGTISRNMFGSTMIAGHADFYPNGGENQPGCGNTPYPLCSHEHCLTLFANSLNNPAFKACQCPGWIVFIKWRCDCSNLPVVLMGDSCPNTLILAESGVQTQDTRSLMPPPSTAMDRDSVVLEIKVHKRHRNSMI